jgi:hypothetical protein
MSDRIYERFSGMLNTSDSPPCHIIGVGAVGRPLALMLARAGARVNVYDDDTVDWPNVGTQGYHADDVGKPKAHALMDEMKRMLPPEKHTFRGYQQRVEEVNFSNWSHVFLCVDSMETRAQLTENKASVHYYDVRCGSRVGNLQYYMNSRVIPEDQAAYEKYKSSLFDDSESSPAPCGMQTMPHVSQFAAALAFNMYCDVHMGRRQGYQCQVFDLFDGIIDNYDKWPTPSVAEPVGV